MTLFFLGSFTLYTKLMWREEPKELAEYQRLVIPLFGTFLALAALRLMAIGLSVHAKEIFTLLSWVPIFAWHGSMYIKLRDRFVRRLAFRAALARELGPKFLVDITLRTEERELGRDTGILNFTNGCLRYQGLRTEFAIPKDIVKRAEGSATKVGVQVGEELVWIQLHEIEQLEAQGPFPDLRYALGNFWIGPSAGELRTPPAEKAPKALRGQLKRNLLPAVFWVVLTGLGVYEARSLAARGLREAQLILTITFALTAIGAALAPFVRLMRSYRSLAIPPRPEAMLDMPIRSETSFEEVVTTPTAR